MVNPPQPFRMLIADDDPGFRETLRGIFEPCFQTLEAESGEEAIEIAEAESIDIALLDMHMHLMTGLETLRMLKIRTIALAVHFNHGRCHGRIAPPSRQGRCVFRAVQADSENGVGAHRFRRLGTSPGCQVA